MESIWADDKFDEPYKAPPRGPRIAGTRKENVSAAPRMRAINVDVTPRSTARPEPSSRTESATSSSASNGPTLHRPDGLAEARAFLQDCGTSGGKRGGGGGGGRTRATFASPPTRQAAPTPPQPATQTTSSFNGVLPRNQSVTSAAVNNVEQTAPTAPSAGLPKAAPAPRVEIAAQPTPMSIARSTTTTTSAIPAANKSIPAGGTAKPLFGVNIEYKITGANGSAAHTKEQIAAELRKLAEQHRQSAEADKTKKLLQAEQERLEAEVAENQRLETERAQATAAEKERLEIETTAGAAAKKRAEIEAVEKKCVDVEQAEIAAAKRKREWEIEAAKKASEAAAAAGKQAPTRQRATTPAKLSTAVPLNAEGGGFTRASAFESSREASVAGPFGRAIAAPPSGGSAAGPDAVAYAALSYTRVKTNKAKIQQKLSGLLAEVQAAKLELAEAEIEVDKAFAQLEAATSAPELEQHLVQSKLQQE